MDSSERPRTYGYIDTSVHVIGGFPKLSAEGTKTLKDLVSIIAKKVLKIISILSHFMSVSESGSRLQAVFPDSKTMSDVKKCLRSIVERVTRIHEYASDLLKLIEASKENVAIHEVGNIVVRLQRTFRMCPSDYNDLTQFFSGYRSGERYSNTREFR